MTTTQVYLSFHSANERQKRLEQAVEKTKAVPEETRKKLKIKLGDQKKRIDILKQKLEVELDAKPKNFEKYMEKFIHKIHKLMDDIDKVEHDIKIAIDYTEKVRHDFQITCTPSIKFNVLLTNRVKILSEDSMFPSRFLREDFDEVYNDLVGKFPDEAKLLSTDDLSFILNDVNKELKKFGFEAFCNDINGQEAVKLMYSVHENDNEKQEAAEKRREEFQKVCNELATELDPDADDDDLDDFVSEDEDEFEDEEEEEEDETEIEEIETAENEVVNKAKLETVHAVNTEARESSDDEITIIGEIKNTNLNNASTSQSTSPDNSDLPRWRPPTIPTPIANLNDEDSRGSFRELLVEYHEQFQELKRLVGEEEEDNVKVVDDESQAKRSESESPSDTRLKRPTLKRKSNEQANGHKRVRFSGNTDEDSNS